MLTTEDAYQFRKAVEAEAMATQAATLLNKLSGSIPYSRENEELLVILAQASQQCANIAAESRRRAKGFVKP